MQNSQYSIQHTEFSRSGSTLTSEREAWYGIRGLVEHPVTTAFLHKNQFKVIVGLGTAVQQVSIIGHDLQWLKNIARHNSFTIEDYRIRPGIKFTTFCPFSQ